MTTRRTELTHYSDEIAGTLGNHHLPARFDKTMGGYVGISQRNEDGTIDRVLLSPAQVKALKAFLGPPR